jgi:glycogen synthase
VRVLLVNTLYAPYCVGGAERSVQLLAETLVGCGHKVRVVSLWEGSEPQRDVVNAVEVVRLPLANVYWPFSSRRHSFWKRLIWHVLDIYNLRMARQVAKIVDDFRPDVVHTNNLAGFSTSVWSVIKRCKIPLVHTARDYYLFHPNSTLFRNGVNQSPSQIFVRLWSGFRRRSSRHVDVFVGISDYITNFHVHYGFFPKSVTRRIYNTVPVLKVERKTDNDGKRVIGYIGRLTEEKGFDVFCRLAEIHRAEPDLKFVAAGEATGSKQSLDLKLKAMENGVDLLGYVDISAFLSDVSAVVLPVKWNEPFGRVVVECALAGKPVYTNKMGGVTELFSRFPNLFELKDFGGRHDDGKVFRLQGQEVHFEAREVADQYLGAYRMYCGGNI